MKEMAECARVTPLGICLFSLLYEDSFELIVRFSRLWVPQGANAPRTRLYVTENPIPNPESDLSGGFHLQLVFPERGDAVDLEICAEPSAQFVGCDVGEPGCDRTNRSGTDNGRAGRVLSEIRVAAVRSSPKNGGNPKEVAQPRFCSVPTRQQIEGSAVIGLSFSKRHTAAVLIELVSRTKAFTSATCVSIQSNSVSTTSTGDNSPCRIRRASVAADVYAILTLYSPCCGLWIAARSYVGSDGPVGRS